MGDVYCDEVFWVEKPGILLTFGYKDESYISNQNKLRGGAARWNDATKLLIVTSIVLLVLRCRWWWIFLIIGLLVIVFAYYNTHPKSQNKGKGVDTKEGFMAATNHGERKVAYQTTPQKKKIVDIERRFKHIDDATDETRDQDNLFSADKRRTATKTVVIQEDPRLRMTEKQMYAKEKEDKAGKVKYRDNNRLKGLDAPRLEIDDRFSDTISYEVEECVAPPRKEMEGVDKMTKKVYIVNAPIQKDVMRDAFNMYKDSFDDEERDNANREVDRHHESAISGLKTSFIYRN